MLERGWGATRKAILLSLVLAAWTANANEQTLREAQSLLNQGQSQGALELLAPHEPQLAGNPQFDYLYGLALLESGDTGRAVFALERAVAADPGFAAARLELARAYFAEGDLDLARDELVILRGQNPPPAARLVIDNLFADIDSRLQPGTNQYEGSVVFGAGFDSNANAATDASRFLGFVLDPQSRETPSVFASVGGGGRIRRPLATGVVWDTRGDLLQRNYPDATFVNTTLASLRSSIRRVHQGGSYSGGLTAYRLNTDGSLNNEGVSLEGNYNRNLGPRMQWGLIGKYTAIRYDTAQQVRDVDQILGGGALSRAFGDQDKGSYGGTFLFGRDEATETASRYSRDLYGLRLFMGWSFNENVRLQIVGGYSRSEYDSVFFPQESTQARKDSLSNLTLNLSWQINPRWSAVYNVTYQDNDSNVPIFAYDRGVVGVTLRRVWR